MVARYDVTVWAGNHITTNGHTASTMNIRTLRKCGLTRNCDETSVRVEVTLFLKIGIRTNIDTTSPRSCSTVKDGPSLNAAGWPDANLLGSPKFNGVMNVEWQY